MSVTIDFCRLRGTAAAIDHARRQLQSNWWPSVPDPEIVIVRQISARAELSELPRRLYREADRLLGTRVNGWSSSAGDATCVYFRSAAELLARLSLDIALGRAEDIWFWQSFRKYYDVSAGAALVGLWQERSSELPAAMHVLRSQRRLTPVWQAIDEQQAAQLSTGFLTLARLRALDDRTAAESAGFATVGSDPVTLLPELVQLEPAPGPDDEPTHKQRLAFALTVVEKRPHWLAAAHSEYLQRLWFAYRETAFAPQTRRPRQALSDDRVEDPTSAPVTSRSGFDAAKQPPDNASIATPAPAVESADALREGLSRDPARPDPGIAADLGDPPGDEPVRLKQIDSPVDRPDETTVELPLPEWQVQQGGVFYLLNLLNLPLIRERLFASAQAMAFPSGWGWLYRLAEGFGLQPERELARCLAYLSGLAEDDYPQLLPPLDLTAEILDYGQRRYQHLGVWRPALLVQPAGIAYRRPELDIVFRLSDLDIGVRRAALDIDPGWVDWLGTRVRYHYRDGS